MSKFKDEAKQLLILVGGKENIQGVTHCVTRMWFVLVDPSLVNIETIEELPSAKGTFTQSGQFQVIIGNEVQEYYNDFVDVSGIEGVSKEALKSDAKSQQTPIQKIMSDLGEIFAPLIPACRDHVVDHEKDGYHSNFRDRFRNHARFSTTSQRLCGSGRYRNSSLGFWVYASRDDWLPSASAPCHLGWIRSCFY
nr:PTS transporter subunit EIIB [Dubosiella newyorkensis]